jgi:opacity protein-like surface antigen
MRSFVPVARAVALLCCLYLCSNQSSAQSISTRTRNGDLELGVSFGPSFFLGDLGGTQGLGRPFIKDLNLPFTNLMKGLYGAYYPSEWLGFRFAVNFGTLEGSDSVLNDKGGAEHFRKKRNLSFKSSLTEAYLGAEIYPTVFLEQTDGLKGKLRPYGVIGLGVFHFNPKALYYAPNGTSQWVALQPLRLEGQGMAEYPDRKQYSLTQLEIPMGVGIKYFVKENMYVGLEVLHRKTFTDYIDDVSTTYIDPALFSNYLSPAQAAQARQLYYRENLVTPRSRPAIDEQRGDPKQNDAFFSTVLKIGWRLNGYNSALRQLRCPVYY